MSNLKTSRKSKDALRLTFSCKGNDIQLLSTTALQKRVFPSDPTEGYADHAGFWYELRDADNNVLYRRIARSPARHVMELHEPNSEEPHRQHQVTGLEDTFSITVPKLAETETLVFFDSPEASEVDPEQTSASPSEEIARFNV